VALRAQVPQRRADDVNRPEQVGVQDLLDLPVGRFLDRSEHAVAGVVDDHVDRAERVERLVDDPADGGGVGHVEWSHPEPVARRGAGTCSLPTSRSPRPRWRNGFPLARTASRHRTRFATRWRRPWGALVPALIDFAREGVRALSP
jgi:hypothetical protein